MKPAAPLLVLALLALAPPALAAETTVELSGTCADAPTPEHELIPFDVPAGTRELEVRHENLVAGNVLDWGLLGPDGVFRGWGGGNTEPALVGEEAASRSYLTGPIAPGTWSVVLGKALVKTRPATYSLQVILRDAPTLPAQPERTPYVASAALAHEERWYAGDLHVHSIESGDARPPIEEVATFAEQQGLEFVELSDHNTTSQLDFIVDAQARHPKLLLVPGVEFTTYHGHANGIGATRFVDHKIGLGGATIEGAIQQFHEQGALFSLNHPKLDLGDACLGCAWGYDVPNEGLDAIEIVTSGSATLFAKSTLALWDELEAAGAHLAAVGGSDDHRAGVDEGVGGAPIGTPRTMIHAKELSVAALLDGIRAERTVVRFTPDAPMVDLRLDGARLVADVTGGEGSDAVVMRNGEEAARLPVTQASATVELALTRPASGEDRYRVHIEESGRLRTVTSHVYLQPGADAASDEADGGCSCRLGGEGPAPRPWSVAVGAAAVAALVGRRRRG